MADYGFMKKKKYVAGYIKKRYFLQIAAVEVLLLYLFCHSAQRDISLSIDNTDFILFH
jgi:hypothetical protein